MEIIGHKKELKNLSLSIESGNISHSYLFTGARGVGKLSLARHFSKTLLCSEGASSPCGSCSSCKKFESGNHPDFKIIQAEKNIIKKGQVDEIVEAVKTAPFESSRKIFIIDGAHLMNKEAMNGLLKTLEEAPDFLIIILLSSQEESLLPTIISRCQRLELGPLSEEEIYNYIVGSYQLLDKDLRLIARLAKGSLGQAIEMCKDPELMETRNRLIGLIDSLLSGDASLAFTSQDFFKDRKDKMDLMLDIILYWFRDLAIYKATSNLDLLVNSDSQQLFNKHRLIDFSRIDDIIEATEVTRSDIKGNINFQLSIEMLLLKIQEDK